VVRDAAPEDAVAIAEVHIRAWQVAYAHAFAPAALAALADEKPRRTEFWRESIETLPAGRHVLVAESGEGVIGFATAGPVHDPDAGAETGELYAIYVSPDVWGRGAGQALMSQVIRRLRAGGFDEAVLWVLEDNPRTRRFYELGGWRHDGEVRDDTYLERPVRVVRYRIALPAC
jgi:L-amino acid N-acyltransferase YncA